MLALVNMVYSTVGLRRRQGDQVGQTGARGVGERQPRARGAHEKEPS
jgi:hypothetical protein